MVTATVRRQIARIRHPRSATRLAVGLWLVWAAVAWNVVLDHVIVRAGRAYVYAAALADRGLGPSVRMDDYMRPAVQHGLILASIVAGAIAVTGVVAVRGAARVSAISQGLQ